MIRDAFLWLLTAFVVEPAMAEFTDRFAQAQAPQEVMRQVSACVRDAPAALAERAAGDPWWGVRSVAGVALGVTDAQAVLAGASPGCAAAVGAIRPLLAPSPAS